MRECLWPLVGRKSYLAWLTAFSCALLLTGSLLADADDDDEEDVDDEIENVAATVPAKPAPSSAGADEDLGLTVPEGFTVTRYADDSLAHDIFSMTIDSLGRVVVSGPGYVKILVDSDNDGTADRAIDFADGPASGLVSVDPAYLGPGPPSSPTSHARIFSAGGLRCHPHLRWVRWWRSESSLIVRAPDPLELGVGDLEGAPVLVGVVEAGLAETSVAVFVVSGSVTQDAAGVVHLYLTDGPAFAVRLEIPE